MTQNLHGGAGGKFNQGNTHASKLTGAEVMEIREKYASGLYTQARLSREYQVSITTIRNIVHGVTWQNLPGVIPQHVVEEGAMRSMRRLDELLSLDSLPPAAAELTDAEIAAMQAAVAEMPRKEEFDRPSGELADRMAAYGVRPPAKGDQVQSMKQAEEGVSQHVDEDGSEEG